MIPNAQNTPINQTLFGEVKNAQKLLRGVSCVTSLIQNSNYSNEFGAKIYFKREDQQIVRSYKLRGAYTKMASLDDIQRTNGVVCASAGNHAQGVAYSCSLLNIYAKIFMPTTTPKQKIRQVLLFGKNKVEVVLVGKTYDEAFSHAQKYASYYSMLLIHPFDDEKVIAGQGTVGLEILEQLKQPIDYVFLPIGGGGLASGVATVFSKMSPGTKIIGVEPEGAASMKGSITAGINTTLEYIDKFVDGAAVRRVGELTFPICKELLHEIILVPEGKVCTSILRLYNEEGIIVEPAGALAISALDFYKKEIENKTVVCIISGSNNDIGRIPEIKEKSLLYEGLKHYFLIHSQNDVVDFEPCISKILTDQDGVAYFQFVQNGKPANEALIVGIELQHKKDLLEIEQKFKAKNVRYTYLNQNEALL